MSWRKTEKPRHLPVRTWIWTAIAGLIFGVIGFGEIAEDWLRVVRNNFHKHPASGDIVLVKLDDESMRQIGRWPWPRRHHAELTDALTAAGAKRIFFDVGFYAPTEAAEDRRFAESLKRSARVITPARAKFGPKRGVQQDAVPMPQFAQYTGLGAISVMYNYQNAVWRIPYAIEVEGRAVPSYASLLAERPVPREGTFMVDYSLDVATVPAVSAVAVIKGEFNPETVAGKDVVVGLTSEMGEDVFFIPGVGKLGGAYVQIAGAETLKAGTPVYLGWVPLFLASLLIAAIVLVSSRREIQVALLGASIVLLLVGPAPLEAHQIVPDITPALFVLLTVAAVLGWRRFRQRGLVNAISGLPNLSALSSNRAGRDQALIVARILNYAEIAAALPPESERQLVEQIVGRLSVGSKERTFYQGDGGIFAWFESSRLGIPHHIDALSALFRNPVKVAGLSIDLALSFGVDVGSSRSLTNRMGSALVAAEEAAHDGLKWKYYDPESLQNASWRLSMLSQLDSAIEKGEVWVAFQPKLDLRTRRVIGAEALARWTHPEKGPIAASEFVAAAEQHDRIGKLTEFVLEKGIAAAADIIRRGIDFEIAVNLSGRLLGERSLLRTISELLEKHGLPPQHLMLELTETAALAGSGEAFEMLAALRELGVGISIDDYGTGLSTLEYLKKIPAQEIKIDQSFVKGMNDNRSDRLMVQSTIGLAHSLGRRVVAEGVEQRAVLDTLVEMGCDIAQGFIIGRPSSLESLMRRLSSDKRREVA